MEVGNDVAKPMVLEGLGVMVHFGLMTDVQMQSPVRGVVVEVTERLLFRESEFFQNVVERSLVGGQEEVLTLESQVSDGF